MKRQETKLVRHKIAEIKFLIEEVERLEKEKTNDELMYKVINQIKSVVDLEELPQFKAVVCDSTCEWEEDDEKLIIKGDCSELEKSLAIGAYEVRNNL